MSKKKEIKKFFGYNKNKKMHYEDIIEYEDQLKILKKQIDKEIIKQKVF
jgi:hypothetical protein